MYYHPLHPYTRMLMECGPRLDRKWGETDLELAGPQAEVFKGRVQHARCMAEDKDARCADARPALVEVEPDHFVACGRGVP